MNENSRPPGSNGIWTFVFMDMSVFALFFSVFLAERIRLPEVFRESQGDLIVWFGLANTLILLTSSWAMAEGVAAARRGDGAKTTGWLDFCLLLGFFFSVNKVFEYATKVQHGVTPATNSFFGLYFLITGLHFAHVLGGMAFIFYCRRRAGSHFGSPQFVSRLESTGLFWHFVDLLWMYIFPLMYLSAVSR